MSDAFLDPYVHAIHAGYARGARFLDVYFNTSDYSAADVLHEALHVFSGLNDYGLAAKLNVYIGDGNTERISEALKKGGCG